MKLRLRDGLASRSCFHWMRAHLSLNCFLLMLMLLCMAWYLLLYSSFSLPYFVSLFTCNLGSKRGHSTLTPVFLVFCVIQRYLRFPGVGESPISSLRELLPVPQPSSLDHKRLQHCLTVCALAVLSAHGISTLVRARWRHLRSTDDLPTRFVKSLVVV
jgi:hypothetical protein